jgi:hypothetical protein
LVKDFAQQFVGVHGETMEKRGGIGKREARQEFRVYAVRGFGSLCGGDATLRT